MIKTVLISCLCFLGIYYLEKEYKIVYLIRVTITRKHTSTSTMYIITIHISNTLKRPCQNSLHPVTPGSHIFTLLSIEF